MSHNAPSPALQKELLRQQMLLRALWRDARPGVLGGWVRESALAPARFTRGLQAYQAHAAALAERALTAAFPVLAQLIGDESFAGMARAFWHAQAPQRGDMACWGAGLAAFIEAAEQLADEPYLADVARLEWLLHEAAAAADDSTRAGLVDAPWSATPGPGPDAVPGLGLLATADPAALNLRFTAGAALLCSRHPVVQIWQAHQVPHDTAAGREAAFAHARQSLAQGQGANAWVVRHGFKPVVHAVTAATAAFLDALLRGQALAVALELALALRDDVLASTPFDFSAWLVQALSEGWIAAVTERAAV